MRTHRRNADKVCVPIQDFIADVRGLGRPFGWVSSRVSGLLPTKDAVYQPESAEGAPMDLDAGVEQTGAAIAEASQAGQQVFEEAADMLEGKQEKKEKQGAEAEPVENNA